MGSIVGVARVVRGSFPEPVLVNLQVRGATIQSTYTDAEGRFGFNAIYANMYHVMINDDQYQSVDIAAELRPDIQPVYVMQVMLMERAGKSPATSGAYIVSAPDLTRMYSKKAVKEFEHGVKSEAQDKPDEAMDHYRKAIKEASNFADAHNNLGALLIGRSQFADAQKELEQAVRLAPADPKVYFNMANLLLLTGRLPDAEHYLQEGFRKQPDSAFGLFVQGSVEERKGKYADAERALKRALELNPKMTRPHLELVNLYLLQQRSDDAISQLREFLRVAPADPLAPKAREVLQRLETPSSRK